ncbi:50S ribosomal protein L11 methyltransferase, partial [Staphylococcus epidermidis]|uniref:50S ribosomal protein L11 methyltransferase n=1 Tax=Staphylococcus epidermidis TaxID=1282 RepID=UPI001642DC58
PGVLPRIGGEMSRDTYNTLIQDRYFITSPIIQQNYQHIQSQINRIPFKIISLQHHNAWVCIVRQKVSR